MAKKMVLLAVGVTGVCSLCLGILKGSIFDSHINSMVFMFGLLWTYPGLIFTLVLQQKEGRPRIFSYVFLFSAFFLIVMFGIIRSTLPADPYGLLQTPQIVFGIACMSFVLGRLTFFSKQLPPKGTKNVTVVYGGQGTPMWNTSTRLPSGEIRCANCGIVNSPLASHCRNCQEALRT